MHILFLTQIIPYPPDAGPKVKTWHVLRYLAGLGHKISLASFVRPEEQPYLEAVRQVCSSLHVVPIRRSRLADAGYFLRSQLTGRPFLIERDDLHPMRALVQKLVQTEAVDVIHADQLTMAQFALPPAGADASRWPVAVFDAHNAVWTIGSRLTQTMPWFMRPLVAMETRRVKQYEGMLIHTLDHTLAVTELDRDALLQAASEFRPNGALNPSKISVIPIAVDAAALPPVRRTPGSQNVLTLGTLHYPPNADGIRWFLNEVFPLIRRQVPGVTLTIVGKNPPQDFLQIAAREPEAVRVTGYVPDLTPYLEQAGVMVVPVRAGGGMRVRILEALSRGLPVVTTTVGLEGIEARPGYHVLVEDTEDQFAKAVVQLLQDPSLQEKLSQNGRRLIEERYDWQVVLGRLEAIYAKLR